jgi:preprotein translocase subunit YajC
MQEKILMHGNTISRFFQKEKGKKKNTVPFFHGLIGVNGMWYFFLIQQGRKQEKKKHDG